MAQLRLQRQRLSVTFREVARQLCEKGVRLSKSMPIANARSLGPLASGPGEDEELHFDWMENSSVEGWTTDEEAAELVRGALTVCSHPDELAAVIWSPFEAGLRLKTKDLAQHAILVLDRDWTTWIVAAQPASWIVQIGLRSQTVAFSPDVPANPTKLVNFKVPARLR
jgi:hypothetical protein